MRGIHLIRYVFFGGALATGPDAAPACSCPSGVLAPTGRGGGLKRVRLKMKFYFSQLKRYGLY